MTDNSSASGHAAALYGRISADPALTQALFRQALQDPSGALARIVALGAERARSCRKSSARTRSRAGPCTGSRRGHLDRIVGGLR